MFLATFLNDMVTVFFLYLLKLGSIVLVDLSLDTKIAIRLDLPEIWSCGEGHKC